jgi:hypothetical protein
MSAAQQIIAVMERSMLACFLLPEDAHLVPYVINAHIVAKPDGILITTVAALADAYLK